MLRRHRRGHDPSTRNRRAKDNGHHRDNADHPYELYEIARISTLLQLRLLTESFHIPQNNEIPRQLV